MSTAIGTEWVAPGQGATLMALNKATWPIEWTPRKKRADKHLYALSMKHKTTEYKTNLALTGAALTAYDLTRIAACE